MLHAAPKTMKIADSGECGRLARAAVRRTALPVDCYFQDRGAWTVGAPHRPILQRNKRDQRSLLRPGAINAISAHFFAPEGRLDRSHGREPVDKGRPLILIRPGRGEGAALRRCKSEIRPVRLLSR